MRHPTAVPVSAEAHERLVERARRSLLARSAPRLQMTFLVAATGLSGLGASVALRHLGIDGMGLRYGLAVALAYLAFLFLLWLWLRWQQRLAGQRAVRDRARGGDLDPSDLLDLATPRGGPAPSWEAGGGHFAGGGASGNLDLAEAPSPPASMPSLSGARAASGGGSGPSLDLDLDELVAVVLAVLAVASAVVAAGYVIFQAPTLLADLLVDGALAAGLYRRLRGHSSGAWWAGAVRRTFLPALIALAFFVLAGSAIQGAWPEVRTLGELWRLLLG